MKRFGWILVMLIVAAPVWSANKKISVAEMKDMLVSMHSAGKSDLEVATALKQVDLTEELTRTVMNDWRIIYPQVVSCLSNRSMFLRRAPRC